MKINKLLLALLVSVTFSNAQEFKLGKVTIAELEEKQHAKDTTAVAAIIYQKGNVSYQLINKNYFNTITEVFTRIKIYKTEGFNFANQLVNYYSGGRSNVYIKFSDANTYNLVNNKIEVSKLKGDGEFKNNINKFWTLKTITMPNVRVGSIIEFKYTVEQQGVGTPMKWNFQNIIPVDYSEFSTCIPELFIFSKNQKGFVFPKVRTEKVLEKSDYEELKTTYIAKEVPALKNEIFLDNIDNYTSSISHELSAVNFPGRYFKSLSNGWEAVSKELYELDGFKNELDKSNYYKSEVIALTKNLTKRDEKINAILDFVKTKVKWNNNLGFTCNFTVNNAYEEHIGNSAEINLMLISMLRFAEIEANPVLISTRSNGLVFFPSLSNFNSVIAAVEIENDLILIDATDKYGIPNVLPMRDLNRFGRLIRDKGNSSTEVDLIPKIISKDISTLITKIFQDGSVNGILRKQYTNHNALAFRNENLILSKDTYLEKLEKEYSDIEITDYARENDIELSKPIVETFSFKDNKGIEIINNKIYIAPLFFLSTKENPFKQEVREYPVDFGYPEETKFNINIDIPEGYAVETIPVAAALTTGEEIANFKYIITNTDQKIQISITSTINVPIIPADYYDVLKEYFQKVIDKQNEKIVLVKK